MARGRQHERGDYLSTWVCEQRVCESEAATNGVRETVEWPRGGGVEGAGQRLKDMNIYSHEYAVYAYGTG